jgi:hypothetical protein
LVVRVTRRDATAVTSVSASRTDPFGPLTSLVLRDLFAESEGHRDPPPVKLGAIAARTALHVSTVGRIASRLSGEGYTQRARAALTLTERVRALDDWIGCWDATAQVTASFHVGLSWPAFVSTLNFVWRGIDWTWTGAAGATLVGRAAGTPLHRVCYVPASGFDLACARIQRRADVMRDDEGGTFHLVVPNESRAQLYRSRAGRWGVAGVASTVQLALDVACGPDALAPRTAASVLAALRRALLGEAEPMAPASSLCRMDGAGKARVSA